MICAGATDIGQVRKVNEDSILLLPQHGLFAVADGVGGSKGGKVASQMLTGELARAALSSAHGLSSEELRAAIHEVNEKINKLGERTPSLYRMGTTCIAASILQGSMALAQVGDSRAYLYHNGVGRQITNDHRLVQEMVDRGELTVQEADDHPMRNILTRCVGGAMGTEVDLFDFQLEPEDTFLLCSDGLSDMVRHEQILDAISSGERPDRLVNEMIQLANDFGGQDNVSVVVVRMQESDFLATAEDDPFASKS
jgi:protein phosphatase